MKSIFRFTSTIVITVVLLTQNTVRVYSFQTNSSNGGVLSCQNAESDINYVTHMQTKAQVEFFRQALIAYLIHVQLPENLNKYEYNKITITLYDNETHERGQGSLFWKADKSI